MKSANHAILICSILATGLFGGVMAYNAAQHGGNVTTPLPLILGIAALILILAGAFSSRLTFCCHKQELTGSESEIMRYFAGVNLLVVIVSIFQLIYPLDAFREASAPLYLGLTMVMFAAMQLLGHLFFPLDRRVAN